MSAWVLHERTNAGRSDRGSDLFTQSNWFSCILQIYTSFFSGLEQEAYQWVWFWAWLICFISTYCLVAYNENYEFEFHALLLWRLLPSPTVCTHMKTITTRKKITVCKYFWAHVNGQLISYLLHSSQRAVTAALKAPHLTGNIAGSHYPRAHRSNRKRPRPTSPGWALLRHTAKREECSSLCQSQHNLKS